MIPDLAELLSPHRDQRVAVPRWLLAALVEHAEHGRGCQTRGRETIRGGLRMEVQFTGAERCDCWKQRAADWLAQA